MGDWGGRGVGCKVTIDWETGREAGRLGYQEMGSGRLRGWERGCGARTLWRRGEWEAGREAGCLGGWRLGDWKTQRPSERLGDRELRHVGSARGELRYVFSISHYGQTHVLTGSTFGKNTGLTVLFR